MWCSACGQDVPGIAGAELGQFGCARCGMPVGEQDPDAGLSSRPAVSDDGVELTAQRMSRLADVPPLLELEDSELDELVSRARKWTADGTEVARFRDLRIDAPHPAVATPAIPAAAGRHREDASLPVWQRAAGVAAAVSWIGLVILVSGGGLAVQSRLADRVELWHIGLPLLLGGTVAVLLGLMLRWSLLAAGESPPRFDVHAASAPRPDGASRGGPLPRGHSSPRAGSVGG